MSKEINTIGLRLLSALKERQGFIRGRLNAHKPGRYLRFKLDTPDRFTRLFDIHIIRAERKSIPALYLKYPTLVFTMLTTNTSHSVGERLSLPHAINIPGKAQAALPVNAGKPAEPSSPGKVEASVPVKANELVQPSFPLPLPVSQMPGAPTPLPHPVKQEASYENKTDVKSSEKRLSKPAPIATGETKELAPQVVEKFSRFLNLRLPRVFVHTNNHATRYLRQHNADAMTIGRHIYFRQPLTDLSHTGGMALLGHELTHVSQEAYPDDFRRSGISEGREGYEKTALRNEKLVLHHALTFPQTVSSFAAASPGGTVGTPQMPASQTPQFAETSRDLSAPLPEAEASAPPQATLSASERMRMKEEIYRDLMMRMKTEFERGG